MSSMNESHQISIKKESMLRVFVTSDFTVWIIHSRPPIRVESCSLKSWIYFIETFKINHLSKYQILKNKNNQIFVYSLSTFDPNLRWGHEFCMIKAAPVEAAPSGASSFWSKLLLKQLLLAAPSEASSDWSNLV